MATEFDISEDIAQSPTHKAAGTSLVDFDGLLTPPLRLHEDLSEGCGGQLWPAGMLLGKYLLREPQKEGLKDKKILELGAGGGLVGLALALSLSSLDQTRNSSTHIHITDQAQLLPLMNHNIALNQLPPELVQASVLDWGSEGSSTIGCPDVLLAADCVYFEPAFPLLLETMKQLIGPTTICWFCFKKRRRADMRLVKDARKMFVVEDVLDDPSRGVWSREGLFLYKITRKSV